MAPIGACMAMPSTIAHDLAHDLFLHSSDYLPNIVEAHNLRTVVNEQDSTLEALDSRIAYLEAQLHELRAQRATIIESSTVRKALLAPIRRLAPETLGEVFELCNAASSTPGKRSVITSDSPSILLGMVCRRWRRIALGTPQLWTVIALERTSDLTLKVNPFIVITEWLQRSGCLPIDVYLGDGLEKLFSSMKYTQAFQSCMELLGDHFHRCRSFHVTNAFPNILTAVFPPGRCRDASSLRDFRVIPAISTLPQPPLVLGQITAPILESIDVYRPCTFFGSIALDYSRLRTLRWNTSTFCNDRESSLGSLTNVLGLCPNLEECEIVHPSRSMNLSDKSTMVSVPSLRRLRLKFTFHTDPTPLFSVLRTPGLESLTLEQTSPISNIPGFGGALSAFISSVSMPLKELRLNRITLSGEDAALFTPLSRLESLQFHSCFLHLGFLAALAPNSGDHPDTWTVPRLSSLSLISSGFTATALADVIEKRLTASLLDPTCRSRLSSVSLLNCRLPEADQHTLARLVETHDGLCIDISSAIQ